MPLILQRHVCIGSNEMHVECFCNNRLHRNDIEKLNAQTHTQFVVTNKTPVVAINVCSTLKFHILIALLYVRK